MPFQIIRNDITKVKADAIVNTANPNVAIGAGVYAGVSKAVCSVMMAESVDEADECLTGSGWNEEINEDYMRRGKKVRR